ncbi:MAG: hypothetical protein JXA44_09455 [Methanospirillaceae archaeon]|nr:hypothetical protein [Methanospirillaceae archaeon]
MMGNDNIRLIEQNLNKGACSLISCHGICFWQDDESLLESAFIGGCLFIGNTPGSSWSY